MNQVAVAKALLAIDAVGFLPNKPITFKSGIISPVYVDNRRLPFYPGHWQTVINGFQSLLIEHQLAYDIIAGVAVGGIPHSAALAYTLRKPSVFIRKEAKEHGKQKLVEGGDVNNQRVLLIEDLVTTGGSSLTAIRALHAEGALVTDLMAIVSYGFTEAQTTFTTEGITLHTLTNFSIILQVARENGQFTDEQAKRIEDWFIDPHGWAKRHGFA